MRIRSILFAFLFICNYNTNGQNINNFWSLNTGKMLDFNQIPAELVDIGNPVAFTTGMSTALSDSLGKLLFYSNGTFVFDSTHQIMLDGRIHQANNYSRMPAIVIPKDIVKKEYYIFTLFSGPSFLNYERSELFYTIIDLKLNNGLGGIQIINDQKNISIQNDLSGKMIAAKGVCGSVWLVTHGINNNTFFAYEINIKGISPPVVSEIGTLHTDNQGFEEEGFMTFSPDFEKILICGGRDNFAEILDFDIETGKFTNPINIQIEEKTIITTGGSFSKDKSKLYILEKESEIEGSIYQIDFENTIDGVHKKQFLVDVDSAPSQNLQLGPDNVIYVREGEGAISGIYSADEIIENVIFRDSVFFADSRVATFSALHNPVIFPSLPHQIDSLLLPLDQQLCQNTELNLQIQAEGDSYLWQDGSTTKDYEITAPGIYWIEVQKGNCTFTDTLEILPDDSFIDIGTDTTICAGTSLTLTTSNKENTTYQWQDGSTNPDFTVSESGLYWVESSDSLCSHRDSIQVEVEIIAIDLPADTIICPDQNLLLNVNQAETNFRWQDGSTQPTFATNEAGLYWVEAQKGDCSVRDSIILTYAARPTFLPKDTTLCNATEFLIYPNPLYKDVVWLETGNIIDSLLVTESGIYRALFFGTCQWEDTIRVDFQTAMLDLPADTTICADYGLLLDVGTIDDELVWQDGSTDQQFLVTESGRYKATLTKENCTASDSIEVVIAPLNLDLGQDTTLCEDESLALTVSISNVNYEWQDGSNLPDFTITQSGIYWAKITQDNCEAIDSITVNFTPSPTIDLGKDTTLCNGETLILTAPNSISNYEWQDGSQTPIFTASNSDVYWLTGSINNCSSRDSILVTFEDCEPLKSCEAYLPNSFSPNGDGINDELQLLTDCELQFFEMEVYDRWGNLMLSTTNVEQGWDGLFDGQVLGTGVYLWVVRYQFLEQAAPILKMETITLLK